MFSYSVKRVRYIPPALPYILSCYFLDYTQIHLRLHLHMHFQILKLNNVELEIFVLEKLSVGIFSYYKYFRVLGHRTPMKMSMLKINLKNE